MKKYRILAEIKIPEKRRNPRKSAMLWLLDVRLGLTVTSLVIYR
jgi:LPS O-antigen subunit length determinant protein (WzzB/FepE family)